MNQELMLFYRNEGMREAVKKHLIATVEDMAVKALFTGKEAKHIAEAHGVILESFKRLKAAYEPPKKVTKSNSR